MYRKEIRYDRETRDFAMYLDGDLKGFAPNYSQAEEDLNAMVLDLCEQGLLDQPLAALDDPPGAPYPPQGDDNNPDPDPAPGRHLVFAYTAIPCKGCRKAIIADAGAYCPECAAQDQKARAWSRDLLAQIISAADASCESYASV